LKAEDRHLADLVIAWERQELRVNMKSEIRNPKSERNPKHEVRRIWISDFGFA